MQRFLSVKIFLALLLIAGVCARRNPQRLTSCRGRCDQSGTIPRACQCNAFCEEYGDCCADYVRLCGEGQSRPSGSSHFPGSRVTSEELENLSEELINLDTINNASKYISLDLQGKTDRRGPDVAPRALLTVKEEAFNLPTIQKLLKLQNKYNPDVTQKEEFTPEREKEIEELTSAIFSTPVMSKAQEFLISKGLPSGRDNFNKLWFEPYNRGGGRNSSSGFEHVFVGELNKGVGGFHNWVYFAAEEDKTLLNYFGYMDVVDFDDMGSVIKLAFNWRNQRKPVSSMFIGTSPEFELALYTVCFNSDVGKDCPVSIKGKKFQVKNVKFDSNNVNTAFPVI